MALINLSTFKGEIPSYAANLLPDVAAVKAMDCHFDDGTLNPISVNLSEGHSVPADTKTLFLYEDIHWFSWPDEVSVMRSPVARDPYRRVYWTDGVYPKVTYNTIFNGAGQLPATSYHLGVPAPITAPVIKDFTKPADQQSAISTFYVATYVTGANEEGAPSKLSARVECAPIGVEIVPGSFRELTVTYEGGTVKIVDNHGQAVTGFTSVKNVDPKGVGTLKLTWKETAPSDGNEIEITCSQLYADATRSATGIAKAKVGTVAGAAGANPDVINAPKVKIDSDLNDDGVIIPSEIVNGKITISVEVDNPRLVIGGHATIKITNGGTISASNPVVGTVELTLQPPAVNNSNIKRIRIYRTVSGAGLAEFQRVADLPISQASFIDNISDGSLGAILDTETFSVPPAEMRGLCDMANGISAGFVDNQVLFSEVYLPYAWPEAYRFSINYDVVAIEAIGTSLVVGTTGDPYLFTGISPGNIANQQLEVAQACVSARSMVNIGAVVIYACPDGLIAVAPDGIRMATDNIIKPLQWRKMLDPSTIHAYRHEGKYIAVHSKGAFIFDYIDGDFRELGDSWDSGFTDPKDDSLYIVSNGDILKFRQGVSKKRLVWRSKQFTAIAKGFSCCRIIADDINQVDFTLIVDNVAVFNKPAGTVIESFTLPAVRGDKWQFEIGSTTRIESVKLATSKQELKT